MRELGIVLADQGIAVTPYPFIICVKKAETYLNKIAFLLTDIYIYIYIFQI